MLFFYPCERYLDALSQEDTGIVKSIENEIDRLRKRSVLSESKIKLRKYDKSCGLFILKIRGLSYNMRIIIQEYIHPNGEPMYFIRDYISQKEYEPRWRTRIEPLFEKSGEYLKMYPLEKEEVSLALERMEYERGKKQVEKPMLTSLMKEWVEHFEISSELAVYETKKWIQFVNDVASDRLYQFYELVYSYYNTDAYTHERIDVPHQNRNVKMLFNKGTYLFIEDTEILNTQGQRIILILGGASLSKDAERIDEGHVRNTIKNEILDNEIRSKNYKLEVIEKVSYRAYELVHLNDENRWKGIQLSSTSANLALSSEQIGLLKDFVFPKFINGQAGSGKSEILYYLFAEICFSKATYDFIGSPIFLTENEYLLEKARQSVNIKLKENASYFGYDIPLNDKRNFMSFQQFILNNLIDDDIEFDQKKYVNYSVFKRMYDNSTIANHVKKKIPSEVAWFVIYSFIKGYDSSVDELTPEMFSKLPKKDRQIIDEELYKEIFKNIWTGFYKNKREEDYWDRLDLIKWVLNNYDELPEENKYAVILCDEAQDFTKIELELILKMSLYLKYDLSELKQIPLTFAGDPFQTLNPSGFSMEKLKRVFGEVIKSSMGNSLPTTFTEDFIKDLTFNYRSEYNIVNLANVIQYIRHKHLETTDIRSPQVAMRSEDDELPLFFNFKNFDLIKEKLNDAVFIFPCNEGEESKYKDKYNILNLHDINYKTASSSKGSEYPVVILYGFGEYIAQIDTRWVLGELLESYSSFSDIEAGMQFQLSFFFNKLYVAVTRAQKKVFIVDSDESEMKFWSKFKTLNVISDSQWESLEPSNIYRHGQPNEVVSLDRETLHKIALEEKESGINFRDARKMKTAVRYYKKLGSQYRSDMLECQAWYHEFAGEHMTAGDFFSEISDFTNSSKCYFIGGNWGKLKEIGNKIKDNVKFQIRSFVADIMEEESMDQDFLLYHRFEIPKVINDTEIREELKWKGQFLEKISILGEKIARTLEYERSVEIANSILLIDEKSESVRKSAAKIYYDSRDFQKHFELIERLDLKKDEYYFHSKFKTSSDINERLFYYSQWKNQDHSGLINLFEQEQCPKLNDISSEVVRTAYAISGMNHKAILLSIDNNMPWLNFLKENVNAINSHSISFLHTVIEIIEKRESTNIDHALSEESLQSIINVLSIDTVGKLIYNIGFNDYDSLFNQCSKYNNSKAIWEYIKIIATLIAYSKIPTEKFSNHVFNMLRSLLVHWELLGERPLKKYMIILAVSLEKTRSSLSDVSSAFMRMLSRFDVDEETKTYIYHRIYKIAYRLETKNLSPDYDLKSTENLTTLESKIKARISSMKIKNFPEIEVSKAFTTPEIYDITPAFTNIETKNIVASDDTSEETHSKNREKELPGDIDRNVLHSFGMEESEVYKGHSGDSHIETPKDEFPTPEASLSEIDRRAYLKLIKEHEKTIEELKTLLEHKEQIIVLQRKLIDRI